MPTTLRRRTRRLTGLAVLSLAAGAPALASIDSFEGYAAGTNLHGVGAWKGWDNNAAFGASVSNSRAASGANSLLITGATDIVRTSNVMSGQWVYSAEQWISSASTGSSYFILMNTYIDAGNTNAGYWSVQLKFDTAQGKVYDDYRGGAQVALARDQWSQIRVEIDLDANTYASFYNGAQVGGGSWKSNSSSASRIAAVDLYAGSGSAFYDNVSLTPVPAPATASLLVLGCAAAAGRWRGRTDADSDQQP